MQTLDLRERTALDLLIAFADLTRYTATARRLGDASTAELMDGFYHRVAAHVEPAGGRVVKHLGDAALIVFPAPGADAGARALLDLKAAVDDWMAGLGHPCRLVVKAHFGPAIAGHYGPTRRFDVIGAAVNTAATLDARTVALSAAAFRRLAPETRRLFKKHTPPIVYVPSGDPRP